MSEFTTVKIISALEAAVKAAQGEGIHITVSIVNASGRCVGSIAMSESFLASVDYAFWKAWTSASFKMSTIDFAAMLKKSGPNIREGLLAHENVTLLPGGFPASRNGCLMGAIGVSGGNAQQDEAYARAGLVVLES